MLAVRQMKTSMPNSMGLPIIQSGGDNAFSGVEMPGKE